MHTVPHRLAALFQPTTGLLLHSSVEVQYVQKKKMLITQILMIKVL